MIATVATTKKTMRKMDQNDEVDAPRTWVAEGIGRNDEENVLIERQQ
jgi:hypothetical protein